MSGGEALVALGDFGDLGAALASTFQIGGAGALSFGQGLISAAVGGFVSGATNAGFHGAHFGQALSTGIEGAGLASIGYTVLLGIAAEISHAQNLSSIDSAVQAAQSSPFRLVANSDVAGADVTTSSLPPFNVSESYVMPWTLGNEAHSLFEAYALAQGASLGRAMFRERVYAPDGSFFGGRVDFGDQTNHNIYDIKMYNSAQIAAGRDQLAWYSFNSTLWNLGPAYTPGADETWLFPGGLPVSLPGQYATYYYVPGGSGLILYNYVMRSGYISLAQEASEIAKRAITLSAGPLELPEPVLAVP